MAKSPAFQFYAQDFLLGTLGFTAEEVGGYIRLLSHQWDKGFLPNDDKKLITLSGIKPKSLAAVKSKFPLCPDGHLRNDRLEKEREKQAEWSKKASEAGKKSAEARASKALSNSNSNSTPVEPPLPISSNQNPTLQSSSSTSSSFVESAPDLSGKLKAAEVPPLPDDMARAIAERQMQKQGIVANQDNFQKMKDGVYDHWGGWLPVNVTGDKVYSNVNDVYRHYYNRCEQLSIISAPKRTANERPVTQADAKAIAAKYQ